MSNITSRTLQMKLTFRLVFFVLDCWLIERPLKEKEIKDKTSCAFISNHDKCALLILHKNLLDWQKGPALK